MKFVPAQKVSYEVVLGILCFLVSPFFGVPCRSKTVLLFFKVIGMETWTFLGRAEKGKSATIITATTTITTVKDETALRVKPGTVHQMATPEVGQGAVLFVSWTQIDQSRLRERGYSQF